MTPLIFAAICAAFDIAALALARQVQTQQASERDGLAALAVLGALLLATTAVWYLVEVYP